MEEAELFADDLVITTPHPSTGSLGGSLLADLLARTPDVDALFCNNDDLALGTMFEAQRRHISIPQELGICGFNDLEMMAVEEPSLTSIKIDRLGMGTSCIEMLLERLAKKDILSPIRNISYQLVTRESTSRVR